MPVNSFTLEGYALLECKLRLSTINSTAIAQVSTEFRAKMYAFIPRWLQMSYLALQGMSVAGLLAF